MRVIPPSQECRTANRLPLRRSGIAATELALCAPFLLILAFGMIEVCNLVHLQTRMYSAAYETARLATRPTTAENLAATSSQATTYCTTLLQQLGVSGATVTLQPANFSALVTQQLVTVTITAPLSQNTVTSLVINGSQTLTAKATLAVE